MCTHSIIRSITLFVLFLQTLPSYSCQNRNQLRESCQDLTRVTNKEETSLSLITNPQTHSSPIAELNNLYTSFQACIEVYGKEASYTTDSFLKLLVYFNNVSNQDVSDSHSARGMLDFVDRWIYIIDDIEKKYGKAFLLELQRVNVDNNQKITSETYPENNDYSFDGGENQRTQRIADKADLFLVSYYKKAELYAVTHDMEGVENCFTNIIERRDKSREFYSVIDDYDCCVLLFCKWLSCTLFNNGMQSQAIGLMVSIWGYYFDMPSRSDKLKESIEYAQTWICHLASSFDPSLAMTMCIDAVTGGATGRGFYDINNYIEQLLVYAKAVKDVDSDRCLELTEQAAMTVRYNVVGRNGRPITQSNQGYVFNELSQAYCRKRMHRQQLDAIKEAIVADGDHFDPIHVHNLASAYYDVGELNNALETYLLLEKKKALISSSYCNMVYLYHELGRYSEAHQSLQKYYDSLTKEFFEDIVYMTPRVRESYFSNNKLLTSLYDGISGLVIKYDQEGTGIAYNASLLQKGFLVRMNAVTRRKIKESGSEELRAAYDAYLNSQSSDDFEQKREAESNLQRLFPRYLQFARHDYLVEWEDVRDALKKNECAIEFVAYANEDTRERRFAALILRAGYAKPKIIDLCSCNALHSLLEKKDRNGCPRIYSEAMIGEPSKLIWGQLAPYFSGIKTIYYSPCSLLSQMNLDILLKGEKGREMNQSFRMVRCLSTAELVERAPSNGFHDAVLIGGIDYGRVIKNAPASGESFRGFNKETGWDEIDTKSEIDIIAKKLCERQINVSVMTGQSVDEGKIMSLSGDSPSIMHIATHGYYFEESQAHRFTYYSSFEGKWIPDNDRSGLILANANSSWLGSGQFGWDDGTLTASEINGIDLSRTELVILSACQTGLGENNSEDTYGLMRALKNAGARSIIMSLWEVDDRATTVFMTELYQGIASGDEVHDAFIKAQRKVKKEFVVDSAYWAAFVLLD